MAALVKRGEMYHAAWYVREGGKRKKRWKSLSRDERTARRMLREIERNVELKSVGLRQSIPWRDFEEKYLDWFKGTHRPSTVIRIGIIFRHLTRLYPIQSLTDVTHELMDRYLVTRKDMEGIDPATINRELGAIRAAINKARKWKHETSDLRDVERLPVPEKEAVVFTDEQIWTMLDRADPLFRMIILLGLYAGLRRGEMLQVRWQDIDWSGPVPIMTVGCDVWITKTGDIRKIPLGPKLAEPLRAWKAVCGNSENLIPWKHAPHQLTNMFTYFLRKRCGVKEGSIHSLRHTFVTRLQQKDVHGGKVQRLAGHKNYRTTERYTHLNVGDLIEPVCRLDFDRPQGQGLVAVEAGAAEAPSGAVAPWVAG